MIRTTPASSPIFDLDCSYEKARAVVFGAPFDGTASYRPGARFGPKAFRSESYGLETFSPYLERDLQGSAVHDAGDLTLPFGDKHKVLSLIQETAATILADGKTPVLLGGEHLVTLGAVCAASEKYPDLNLIHLDAHADLRDEYLDEKFSHATVIRRCHDLLGDGKIFQFGIRSGTKDEFAFTQSHTFCRRFDLNGLENTVKTLNGKPVYLTIDLDVLDPSVFPGTGTPEAGGISFDHLLTAIFALKNANIVGMDLCELSPTSDPSGISTVTAIKVFRELMLTWIGEKNQEDE